MGEAARQPRHQQPGEAPQDAPEQGDERHQAASREDTGGEVQARPEEQDRPWAQEDMEQQKEQRHAPHRWTRGSLAG